VQTDLAAGMNISGQTWDAISGMTYGFLLEKE
jgi:hypothetical protein